MRVSYRALRRRGAPVVYQQAEVAFCCATMQRRWGGLIGFGVKGVAASTSCEVNLCIDRPQANGKTILEVIALSYCPFCGAAVEVCEVTKRLPVA